MRKNLVFLTTLIIVMMGCVNPGVVINETGRLELKLQDEIQGKNLQPNVDMTVTSYVVSGSGPNNNTFNFSTAGPSLGVDDLAFGIWNISVEALNAAGLVIGRGNAVTTIHSNESTTVSIIIAPLTGNGALNLSVIWNTQDLDIPGITARLLPQMGSPIPLDFTYPVSGRGEFNSTAIPAGYYTLTLELQDNNVTSVGTIDIVRIVQDANTSGDFEFTHINSINGRMIIDITPGFGDPIEVTLPEIPAEIAEGDRITLTPSVPAEVGNVTYVWYINGQAVATGDTYTIENYTSGIYYIGVTAYTANGSRAGAATDMFEVLQVVIPPPIHDIEMNEGNGTTVTDRITGAVLSTQADSINWARGTVKGETNRTFIQSSIDNENRGIVEGNLIQNNLDEYTITFLTRITSTGNGCIFRNLTDSLHFRFWNGVWDSNRGFRSEAADTIVGDWLRFTIVQDNSSQYFYVNDTLSATRIAQDTLFAGDVRLGAYIQTGYFYPGEYCDFEIYDVPFTAEQVTKRNSQDGSLQPFASLSTGDDLGGIWKREEHWNQYDTNITIENGMYRHWFNGASCWAAVSKMIPAQTPDLWVSADFFYPTNLTANHDYGRTGQTAAIYADLGRSNPIAILLLNHESGTDILTLGSISYRTSAGTINHNLDGRVIDKGRFYNFEIHYRQGTDGVVAFYMDGEELFTTTGNFDLVPQQAMYGFNQGIHPEAPGDVIYSDNIYAGVLRYSDYISQ